MDILSLTRKQLYDEIWATSIKAVADKYDEGYDIVSEIIKRNDIPVPTLRYYNLRNKHLDTSSEVKPLMGDYNKEVKQRLQKSGKYSLKRIEYLRIKWY